MHAISEGNDRQVNRIAVIRVIPAVSVSVHATMVCSCGSTQDPSLQNRRRYDPSRRDLQFLEDVSPGSTGALDSLDHLGP